MVVVQSGADFKCSQPLLHGVRIDTLEPNTMYDFSVAAMTSVGRGPFTSIANITTLQEGNSSLIPGLPTYNLLHICI